MKLPAISIIDNPAQMTLEAMPFWEGVQDAPGVRKSLPFVLSATTDGPIRQITSQEVVGDVVEAYRQDEYNFITAPPGASAWANSLGNRSVQEVVKVVGNTGPDAILEIGGGSTWVAGRLRERYRPSSYVLVDPAIRETCEGVEIVRDYFPCAQLADRRFDLILGFSVLEHVPDPLQFLRDIRKKLADGGKVVLIYPDCENQFRTGDMNAFVHEHLSYFTEASSRWLAASAGFEVISLTRQNDGFTLALAPGDAPAAEGGKLDESQLLLHGARMLQQLLTDTAGRVRRHLDNSEYVGFHGATHGLNSFLFMTGLGEHPNVRIYDGDQAKEGRYLPACPSPIRLPSDGSYAENSLIIVSAMSFFSQIREYATEKAGLAPSRLMTLTGEQP